MKRQKLLHFRKALRPPKQLQTVVNDLDPNPPPGQKEASRPKEQCGLLRRQIERFPGGTALSASWRILRMARRLDHGSLPRPMLRYESGGFSFGNSGDISAMAPGRLAVADNCSVTSSGQTMPVVVAPV
jgi:hypothetical protein